MFFFLVILRQEHLITFLDRIEQYFLNVLFIFKRSRMEITINWTYLRRSESWNHKKIYIYFRYKSRRSVKITKKSDLAKGKQCIKDSHEQVVQADCFVCFV